MRCACLLLVLFAGESFAEPNCCDDPKRDCCRPEVQSRAQVRNAYPTALIDRPLILPRLMVQVAAGVGATAYTPAIDPSRAGAQFSFGADLGIARRLQVGLYFDLPVYPQAQFETFIADLQIGLTRQLNLRIDLGAKRVDGFGDETFSRIDRFSQTGFLAGLGLPLRVRLHRMFALASGSPSAHGFGIQPMVMRFDSSIGYSYYGGQVRSSDVLAIWATNNFVLGTVTVPVGLQFQPIPQLLLGASLAYRFSFTKDALGTTRYGHALPLAFDAAATLRWFDVGITATVLGTLGDDYYEGPIGWAGAQQYDFHIVGRF